MYQMACSSGFWLSASTKVVWMSVPMYWLSRLLAVVAKVDVAVGVTVGVDVAVAVAATVVVLRPW